MGEYGRLIAKARMVELLVENPVCRLLEAAADAKANAKAEVMRFFGTGVTETGAKVREDFFVPIATSEDGSEVGVQLEGNKMAAITSYVVYPALECEEGEPALYTGAEDAVVHFLTGFSPYSQTDLKDEPVGDRAA